MISKDVMIETLLAQKEKHTLIDVRSPGEYADATIPGAMNVPLFTNEERAIVGTIYKEQGQRAAKWEAMNLVSPKLPALLAQIKEYSEERQPVLFCWRGGMRSLSMSTFSLLSGIPVLRLSGGYRAYRQYVTEHLTANLVPATVYVLHGMTGVGKTHILERLAQMHQPILDLEHYAGHRGSVFGAMGIKEKNQKMFDALLFDNLLSVKGQGFSYAFMEAESRRIGRVVLPEFLMEAKRAGTHFFVTAPLEARVERIYQDYIEMYQHEEWFVNKVLESFQTIARRMETSIRNKCYRYLIEKEYHLFIRTMLKHYYDPRYNHKEQGYEGEFIPIDASDLDQAAEQLLEYHRKTTFW